MAYGKCRYWTFDLPVAVQKLPAQGYEGPSHCHLNPPRISALASSGRINHGVLGPLSMLNTVADAVFLSYCIHCLRS